MSKEEKRKFKGVFKDPLDLRDLMYEPSLQPLPRKLDNHKKCPSVLNQKGEGACTGFSLAGVVNYLLHNHKETGPIKELVSARMLYEMAKRYDEWEGENYEGSSIRGAMKGWNKHGVCEESLWSFVEDKPGSFTSKAQLDALKRPLGAYYRVRHLHLNHMHSALNEVGILYASSAVHEGWYEVDTATGKIPCRQDIIGGHAFAIVGYDEEGFLILNSWGPSWGLEGFGHLSYYDWLENAYDCWVARMGVPTVSRWAAGEGLFGRASTFDYVPHEAAVISDIRPHFVNLGNDGRFSQSGMYTSSAEEVEEIILKNFSEKAREWGENPKLLLYAHGGLNTEKASARRISSMKPYFLGNEIYPIHFMWETGFRDAVKGIVQDAFRHGRFMGWKDIWKERFQDLLDEVIELGSRRFGKLIWKQIKDNAKRASVDEEGGARILADKLDQFKKENGGFELHMIGHSAGSVFLAYLIRLLRELDIPIKTLTFYAPACTNELFKSHISPFLGSNIERLTIFNLNDKAERDDQAGPIYHKSLLYLVSEAFETKRSEHLLGMEKYLSGDADIVNAVEVQIENGESTVIHTTRDRSDIMLKSNSKTHGGFDNDEATLNSTLRIILGRNTQIEEFSDIERTRT